MKTLVLISLLAFLVGTVTNAATTDEAQAKDKAVDVSDERFEDDLREDNALGDDEEDEDADEELKKKKKKAKKTKTTKKTKTI